MRHPRKFTSAEWTGIWDRIRQRVTPPLRRTSLETVEGALRIKSSYQACQGAYRDN